MFRTLRETFQSWVVFNDPPDHTRLRKLMDKAFRKRVIMNLRQRIEAACEDLLSEAISKAERRENNNNNDLATIRLELIKEFANPLPARVIADLLGVPHADMPSLVEWSNGIAGFVLVSRNDKDKYVKALNSLKLLRAYFLEVIEAKKRRNSSVTSEDEGTTPPGDVLDGMIRASEGSDKLTLDELIATSILLIFAGHETTTHLIANGALAFARSPGQIAAMREMIAQSEALAASASRLEKKTTTGGGDEGEEEAAAAAAADPFKNAVEEVLRYDGPSLANVRVARANFQLAPHAPVRAKDRLFLFGCSANRDAEVFGETADEFDVRRPNAKRNLAFGFGKHFCIGAPLARLEGEIAFREIFKRFSKIELDTGSPELIATARGTTTTTTEASPPFVDLIVTRGMKSLPLVLELRRRRVGEV